MLVVSNPDELSTALSGSAVTIGNFDGVHKGHQQLIGRTVARAKAADLTSVVVTFDPHPVRFFSQGKKPPFITLLPQKLELIAGLGPQACLVLPFGRQLADMTPREFVQKILVDGLKTKELYIGYDYAFGKRRAGNFQLLSELGAELGFAVERIDPVVVEGAVVSSTRIRDLITAGRVWDASRLLGRFYQVVGEVVHGAGRGGKQLGTPTANLLPADELLPKPGVYAVQVELDPPDQRLLPGVANLGYNPTFQTENDLEPPLSLEAHILADVGRIYGHEARVHFVQRIRDEKKFSGPEELKARIAEDVRLATSILSSVSCLNLHGTGGAA